MPENKRFRVIVGMEFVGEIEAVDITMAEFWADRWDAETARDFELLSGPSVMEIEEISD